MIDSTTIFIGTPNENEFPRLVKNEETKIVVSVYKDTGEGFVIDKGNTYEIVGFPITVDIRKDSSFKYYRGAVTLRNKGL